MGATESTHSLDPALSHAIRTHDLNAIRTWHNQGGNLRNWYLKYHMRYESLMAIAIRTNFLDLVWYLTDNGIFPDETVINHCLSPQPSHLNVTALEFAISIRQFEIVKYLVRAYVPNRTFNHKLLTIKLITSLVELFGFDEFDLVVKSYYGEHVIVYAVWFRKHCIIKYLIEQGANVNSQPYMASGLVDLSLRSYEYEYHRVYQLRSDQYEITKYLLDQGADPNVKDYRGNTALINMVIRYIDILGGEYRSQFVDLTNRQVVAECLRWIELLVSNGADIHAANDMGQSLYTILKDRARLNSEFDDVLRYVDGYDIVTVKGAL